MKKHILTIAILMLGATLYAQESYKLLKVTRGGEVVSSVRLDPSVEITIEEVGSDDDGDTPTPGGDGKEHAYVDLGLPSGTLWARTNVGAETEFDYGDYFAWGETKPKEDYSWSTYPWYAQETVTTTDADGFIESATHTYLDKYNTSSIYARPGTTPDNKTTLEPADDAATANWGSEWCMPTYEQWSELNNSSNCTWQWVTMTKADGTKVNGYKVSSTRNDNYLFLPAAGCRYGSSLSSAGSYGYYWSSSLDSDDPLSAYYLVFGSGFHYWGSYYGRYYGQSVRPVRVSAQN